MLLFFCRRRKTVDICTNFIVFLQEEKDCRHLYTFVLFFFRRRKTVDICTITNLIVFLQEEKENVNICNNCIVFLHDEKDTADM